MPLPVPSPARLPRPSLPQPKKRFSLSSPASPAPSPSRTSPVPRLSPSRIPSFSSSPRPHTASSETEETPPSSSHSPARTLSTSSRIPSLSPTRAPSTSSQNGTSSRPSSASSDASRMPPPPVPAPGKRASISERSTTSSSGKTNSEKKSALGRAGSVIRRTVGVKKDDKEKTKAKTAEPKAVPEKKSIGRTMTLRSAATSGTKASSAKGKEEKPEKTKASGVGRTMSLRSRSSVTEEPKAGARPSTGSTARPRESAPAARPKSMGPLEMSGAPSTRRPPTSSGSKESIAAAARKPALAPAPTLTGSTRSHRRTGSTASTISTTSTTSKATTASASAATKPKRPAFSTFNQPLDPPAQPAVPPSPRSKKALPPPPLDHATIHKQAQLLQLMVLYSTAGETYDQLCESADQKLRSRFEAISSKHAEERAKLQELQKSQDFAGLAAVVETPATGLGGNRRETLRSPEEKIQAFSEALKRLESLQGNEYRRVEKQFGEWIVGYAPPSPSPYGTQRDYVNRRGRWIDGLGESWRREALSVVRRIETSIRGVEAICQCAFQGGEDGGVVGMVAEGWAEVARGMLEECEVMRKMERDIVTRERYMLRNVVEGVVRSSLPSTVSVGGGGGGGGGVWGRY